VYMIKFNVLSYVLLLYSVCAHAQNSNIKSRSESFFGVHFDFHAQPNDNQIGKSLTYEMVDQFLSIVKPDYIQVDTKGHPGISSYPTKIGVPAANIIKDPLTIFRSATLKRNVGLYSHFSGVIDAEAVKNHSEWARINADGKKDATATSIFGGYSDKYFIPQITELSKKYNIDGIWVDGDCWGVQADFSAAAKKAYQVSTGKQATLDNDYMHFTRKAFHQYLAHYTVALHKYYPKLQIASNWAYTSYMPGPIDSGVDFLSGDIVNDDIKNIAFEARVISNKGKPWDLMVWGFTGDKNGQGHYWKSARMLKQKASAIISQGGGYEVYINQNRDASIPLETAPALKEVAAFCRARKPYCFKTTAIPQIALLASGPGHDYDLGTSTAFNQNNGGNDNAKGTLSMLLNSQYAVQVLDENNLKNNLNKYPLLVITEWNFLEPSFINRVQNYVSQGGKLLVIGGVSCNLFNNILSQKEPFNKQNPAGLPITVRHYGKGIIAGINANISLAYYNTPDDRIKQTVVQVVKQLFPGPAVSVEGSKNIQVSISKNNSSTFLHLINADDHLNILSNNQVEFALPQTAPLNVVYKFNKKPTKVALQPDNVPLKYNYANGYINFKVPGVDIYSIIEVK
jgi:hypothetical protein